MAEPRLKEVSLGIRHRRSFQIGALSGTIIDRIANDPSSPFFRDSFSYTFPIIDQQGDLKGRVLSSKNETGKGDSLSIDIDSVLISVREKSVETALKKIKETYLPYMQKHIFNEFELYNLNREGIVFDFEIDLPDLGDKILRKASNGTFSNASLFDFKFAEKEKEPLSFVLKEYFDYQIHIVSIRNTETTVQLKYDFQVYFLPEVERINDLDINSFIDKSQELLKSKLLAFLDSYAE